MATKLTDSITLYDREDWGAAQPRDMTEQGWDAHEVFLHHTSDTAAGLFSLGEQCARMRYYQRLHMGAEGHEAWADIGYHFVAFPPFVTPAGTEVPARLFQGRERHFVPAAQEGHNRGTLAVCVVGNYQKQVVPRNVIYAVEVLLKDLMSRGAPLKTLGGHKDVVSTECPGRNLYSEVTRIAAVCGLRPYS